MTGTTNDIIQAVVIPTPCGEMILGSWRDKLCLCDWLDRRHGERVFSRLKRYFGDIVVGDRMTAVIARAFTQLDEYFGGTRRGFDIDIAFAGSEFQISVWRELQKIPYGTLVSYATVARNIGNERGVRAVAQAIGDNPVSIIVPCHRVIGSNGKLTGYAGGLDAKRFLLNLEAANLPQLEW